MPYVARFTPETLSRAQVDGQPGPLEAALLGTEADDAQALAVQHIVRSFDPCQVCTVQ